MEGISSVTNKNIISENTISKSEIMKTEPEQNVEKTKETDAVDEDTQKVSSLKDEYISSEGKKPSGLYNVEKDKEGKTVIKYEDPHKGQDVKNDISSKTELKTKKDTLKMKLKTETDEHKIRELKRKISDIDRQIKNENN